MRKTAIIGNSVMLKASLSLDQLNAILMFFNGLEIGFGATYNPVREWSGGHAG